MRWEDLAWDDASLMDKDQRTAEVPTPIGWLVIYQRDDGFYSLYHDTVKNCFDSFHGEWPQVDELTARCIFHALTNPEDKQ
jgi:hypothetical protein